MPILFSYPEKSNPVGNDLLFITDSASNATNTIKISSIQNAIDVVDTFNADAPLVATGTGTGPYTGAITLSLGTVPVNKGGTNLTSYTQGDLLYAPSGAALQGLSIGTAGQVLKVNSGGTAPEWSSDSDTTYTAGDGLDLTGTVFSTDLKANGGLVIEATEIAVDLGASAITGTLAVADGGTGLTTVGLGNIPRGNTSGALIQDNYIVYEGTSKSLKLRGTGNTQPTLSCTLGIDDAQGPSNKIACIGLTPTGAQGARGIHVDLGAYNEAIQINRNNGLANVALRFYQTVSGSTDVGSITMTNSATAYNTSSDYRLKENIVDMTDAVDRVKQLSPKRFNFISEPEKVVDGFLAHEAKVIVPESVTGSKDEVDANGEPVYQGIDQAKLVPLLVGAIKELTARIEALEA